jgi:hypothetical protein
MAQRVSIYRVVSAVARNLGLPDANRYLDSFIEWAFEAEKKIGSFKTFIAKEREYSSSAEAATATLKINGVPSTGDKITLNGVTFNFDGVGTDTYAINQGASIANTSDNIATKLQAVTNPKINVATYVSDGTDTITITYDTESADGNEYRLISHTDDVTPSDATLTGGKDIVQNRQIYLPSDFIKVIDIRSGDTYLESSMAHSKTHAVGYKTDRFYVSDSTINFTDDETSINLIYLGIDIDAETGFPTVAADHEDAISSYIMWRHKSIDYYNGKLPQYIYRDLERRWYWLCGQARGNDNMPNPQELQQINRVYNSLIPVIADSTRSI